MRPQFQYPESPSRPSFNAACQPHPRASVVHKYTSRGLNWQLVLSGRKDFADCRDLRPEQFLFHNHVAGVHGDRYATSCCRTREVDACVYPIDPEVSHIFVG